MNSNPFGDHSPVDVAGIYPSFPTAVAETDGLSGTGSGAPTGQNPGGRPVSRAAGVIGSTLNSSAAVFVPRGIKTSEGTFKLANIVDDETIVSVLAERCGFKPIEPSIPDSSNPQG